MRKYLIFALLSFKLYATPDKVEFIFLAEKRINAILNFIQQKNTLRTFPSLAENTNCIPMGGGCFHPQFGIIPKEKSSPSSLKEKKKVADPYIKTVTINSEDVDLITCDKGNHFDIFCGKSTSLKKNAKIEVWIDTSSSMRSKDYSQKEHFCARKTFVKKLQDSCGSRVSFSIFNTSKKELGDLSSLCLNIGDNNEKRLVNWIKNSSAHYLLVVTDLEEYNGALREFIEVKALKSFGLGVKPFDSDSLLGFSKKLEKVCRNN